MKKIISFFALCAFIVNAYATDLFQVNVVIFQHLVPQDTITENFAALTTPPDFTNSITPQLLPQDESQLGPEVQKLQRRKDYRILLNISWQQEIRVSRDAKAIRISSDDINGTLLIKRDRYFNIKTNLVFADNYQMLQTRRMRSNELNYLDHPLFGMLIKINAVKASQSVDNP